MGLYAHFVLFTFSINRGNEWYRRLIRSNRPLYRACPKHTKLLVSKAIVQAVEQQGGRFLERNKSSGVWNTVSYKRAVDKTSQGLRERDREDDATRPQDMEPQNVPDSFSGRQANPSLNDLAEVAIAHASAGDDKRRKRAPPDNRPNDFASSQPNQQQLQPPNKRMCDGLTAQEEELVPLPPGMEPRQSSMFRLLKHTKLLPGNWNEQQQQQTTLQQQRASLQQRQQSLMYQQQAVMQQQAILQQQPSVTLSDPQTGTHQIHQTSVGMPQQQQTSIGIPQQQQTSVVLSHQRSGMQQQPQGSVGMSPQRSGLQQQSQGSVGMSPQRSGLQQHSGVLGTQQSQGLPTSQTGAPSSFPTQLSNLNVKKSKTSLIDGDEADRAAETATAMMQQPIQSQQLQYPQAARAGSSVFYGMPSFVPGVSSTFTFASNGLTPVPSMQMGAAQGQQSQVSTSASSSQQLQQPQQQFQNQQQLEQAQQQQYQMHLQAQQQQFQMRQNQQQQFQMQQNQQQQQQQQQLRNQQMQMQPAQQQQGAPGLGDTPAPALTRLTTQVSDWLKNSFYPVNLRQQQLQQEQQRQQMLQQHQQLLQGAQSGGNHNPSNGGPKMSRDLAVSTATAISSMIPLPTSTNAADQQVDAMSRRMVGTAASDGSYDPLAEQRRLNPDLPAITTVPPPAPIQPVQINTIEPMKSSPNYSKQMIQKQLSSNSYSTPYLYGAASQQPNGNESSREHTTTEEVPVKTGDEGASKSEEDAAKVPPSEVERSVSASLLALASTPTGLFKGLSSLFADRSDSGLTPPAHTRGLSGLSTFGSQTPPPPVGFKKSKRSLLDDDDETEEESRLRAVPWK